jgi:hypothetical protein
MKTLVATALIAGLMTAFGHAQADDKVKCSAFTSMSADDQMAAMKAAREAMAAAGEPTTSSNEKPSSRMSSHDAGSSSEAMSDQSMVTKLGKMCRMHAASTVDEMLADMH